MIRPEIQQLVRLGTFPSSQQVDGNMIRQQEQLLRTIKGPISVEEAEELVRLFGPDDYFGLAWTVLHLVESAPGWPIEKCLSDTSNEWIVRLRDSFQRKQDRGY
jgi:hypothetical protein